MSKTAQYIDREEAAKVLKVSTRTVDRYIRKNRFKTRKNGRRIMIKQSDIDTIIKDQIGQFIDTSSFDNIFEKKPIRAEKPSSIAVKDVKVEDVKSSSRKEESVYKELYLETKKDLKEKQERLEAATYRVGQLESKIEGMVPMLDFTRKERELKEAQNQIEIRQVEWKDKLTKTEAQLRNEKVIKWIYLSLVGTLLVVEPILFLFWAFG